MTVQRCCFVANRRLAVRRCVGAAMVVGLMAATSAGGLRVGVIHLGSLSPDEGPRWCEVLVARGHVCTLLPASGPGVPLTEFDVVVDLSGEWTDPEKTLGSYVAGGGGVVVGWAAPYRLGVTTDPEVQAWIGANATGLCGDRAFVAEAAPILPGRTVGTVFTYCWNEGICGGLADTSGHPDARAVILCDPGSPTESILILRNTWQAGRSVFLWDGIRPWPGSPSEVNDIIANAVRWAAGPAPIPAVSPWGLGALTVLLAVGGAVLLRGRRRGDQGHSPEA